MVKKREEIQKIAKNRKKKGEILMQKQNHFYFIISYRFLIRPILLMYSLSLFFVSAICIK